MDNEDRLFQELASDEGFARALAEHEAACQIQPSECPACRFFENVHYIRHMIELVDPEKVLDLAGSYAPEFVSDILAISQFFMATSTRFIDSVDWSGDDEEDEDWDPDSEEDEGFDE